jgi:hypothetical protein
MTILEIDNVAIDKFTFIVQGSGKTELETTVQSSDVVR